MPTDRQALLDFFLPVSIEERRYMRHNVNDPQLIASWTENIDYDKVFPLVATVGDRIVGEATLHFNDGPARHRAEIRIFLAKDFKRRGLGSKLIQVADRYCSQAQHPPSGSAGSHRPCGGDQSPAQGRI